MYIRHIIVGKLYDAALFSMNVQSMYRRIKHAQKLTTCSVYLSLSFWLKADNTKSVLPDNSGILQRVEEPNTAWN